MAAGLTAGDFVYAGGIREAGARDVAEQTCRVIARLAGLLAEQGSSLDRAASLTVYLRSASDFQAMNDAYRTFWPKEPPTRTTVVADLVEPGALVEISAIAVRAGAERTIVHPKDWIASPNPYSYAIRSGDILFLSGLVSRNGRDNTVVGGAVSAQTRVVLDNAGELLRAAGLGFGNVVSSRVFLPDPSAFAQMNEVYGEYFPSSPPARATVAARLAGSQYAVEISMIASAARAATFDDGLPAGTRLPLSAAVRVGKHVYLSGALGLTATNRADVAAQAREALARLGQALRAAGCSPEQVVDLTTFLPDLAAREVVDEQTRAFLRGAPAAQTTIGAGLVAPGALVEIMMTATAP